MTVKGRDFVSLGKKIGGIVLTIIAAAFIFIGLLLGFGALVTTIEIWAVVTSIILLSCGLLAVFKGIKLLRPV